jgi:hypothetical protein
MSLGCGNAPKAITPASATAPAQDASNPRPAPEAERKRVPPAPAYDELLAARLTDTSKLLAGLPLGEGSELAEVQQTKQWAAHARFMSAGWERLERDHLARIRPWSKSHLVEHGRSTVFYPFSGPDFLFAQTFFPEGQDYVLVGLEPVGAVPDLGSLPADGLDRELRWVDESLCGLLQISFFRTNDMKVGFAEEGVLPILLVFLARTENAVLRVEPIGLDGQAVTPDGGEHTRPKGVLVTFLAKGETSPRRLYYFSVDLSDYSLKAHREFTHFLKSLPSPTTYLKAASYLMYREKYSRIRSLILSRSTALLQDDSGIPYKEFAQDRWRIDLFGEYKRPISLFADRFQPDLAAAYAKSGEGTLEFGVGYKHRPGEANLMLALASGAGELTAPACPEGREYLSRGLFGEAARAFQNDLPADRPAYSIRIAVSCLPSSIAGAVRCAEGRPEFLLVPGQLGGQPCYQALWGLYPSRADALAALDEVPQTFTLKDTPAVIRLDPRRQST